MGINDKAISLFPEATTLNPDDLFVIVQGGVTKKITAENAGFVVYQNPTFSSFNIQGLANPLEVGDSISGVQTFQWTTTNSGNVLANSIKIYKVTGGLAVLLTGLANDGSEQYNFATPIQFTTNSSYTWRIEGATTEALPTLFNRDFTENAYWRKYWGTNPNDTINGAQILALTSSNLDNNGLGTLSFDAADQEYKYLAVESSLTQPTVFTDQDTGFNVAMESPFTVSVTNSFGITTNYSVYRTTNKLGGAITIIYS